MIAFQYLQYLLKLVIIALTCTLMNFNAEDDNNMNSIENSAMETCILCFDNTVFQKDLHAFLSNANECVICMKKFNERDLIMPL